MTWPTHGAGPTTPEPGEDDAPGGPAAPGDPPRREDRRRDRRWPEPPWNQPPQQQGSQQQDPQQRGSPEETLRIPTLREEIRSLQEPGADEPGWTDSLASDAGGRRGRHSAPDPLPPIEGPMLGGGPTPAETTLPLALSWPAPPARPRPGQAGSPGAPGSPAAPPGWRRVPRPAERPAPGHAQPHYQPHQPSGYRPPSPPGTAGAPGAPGQYREPAGPRGPGRRERPAGPLARPGRASRGRPAGDTARAPTQRASLVRSGAGMAVGTLVSRGTGFLRTFVLLYAVGTSYLGNAYNNANTLPNAVYYLMLGGIFTSVVVPLLVRAAKRDPDRGEAYAQRMFTLGALALLVVTVLATLAAGPLVDLSAPGIHGSEHHLMVVWAYFFIPQIFFYGMSSLIGAILNTRGRFAAPMWTPVINNVVVIVVGTLYFVTVGTHKDPSNISGFGIELLGIGTTLGVVGQTVALFPSLRAVGFKWQYTLGFRRAEVSEMGRMASWMLVYVVSQYTGNLIAQIIANAASAGQNGYSAYAVAWQLFQLPYAIVGISVITALLPRMSEHASARRYSLVRDDFSIGVRLAAVIVVPAAVYLGLLGGPLAEFLIAHGSTSVTEARYIGEVFGLFSLGLVPYMMTQLQLRVFYSFQDSRTAAFVGLLTMAVSIVASYIAFALLPRLNVVAGLAVAYGIANLIGTIAGWALLLRRVGSLDGWAIARSLARMHLATVPGLVFAWLVMIGAGHAVHDPSSLYGLVVIVVGGGGAVALYVLCARALRIAEFGYLTQMMTAKFGGQSRRH